MAAVKSHAEALNELGLSGSVHDEDIRLAFRRRLKDAHPDLHGGTDMRLRRLILARDLLMSPSKKTLETAELPQPSLEAAPRLTISLHQALFGGPLTAEVPALEASQINEPLISLIQTKTLHISLPCGLRDGEIVRLPCQGAAFNDMRFRIHIEPESDCRVWGDDIWMTANLENRLLQRGGDVIIETPHGPQTIKIDGGVPHGASLCLYGKGLPVTATAPAGNLHIRLEAVPDIVRPANHVLNDFRQRWAS